MLQSLLPSWFFAVGVALWVLHYVWKRFFSFQGLPKSLPWAGALDNSALERARAARRSFFGLREAIQHGYYNYSKKNRAFVLPNLATGAEVIIPMSQVKWLLEQPDNVLNQNEVNSQFLHANRTMLHPNVIRDTVHGNVIRREMTKDLDHYAEAIVEEIEHALSLNWGRNVHGWTEVNVYDTMLDVIARISNRVLVGLPLCRDQAYLRSTSSFARQVVITAGAINLLPSVLRPLLSPLITAYDMYHYRRIVRKISPIIKDRIGSFGAGLDYRNPDYSKHNDYVQWALHDAFSHDDPNERTPEMITKRLTVLSFAAIQSSVITITNALFDIASSPRCDEFQQVLREEVREVASARPHDERWKRASLACLIRIDSALRESMRLWGFISRGLVKKVVDPCGITLPSGEHLPYGAKVGVTSYAIHHDESIYKNAYEYDALRFSDHRDEADKGGQPSLVTSSDHFMAFSHGRHACPGRFFAANQLKLLLSQIVTNYEIEPIAERPSNPWLNNSIGPPIWSKLRVRRRSGTELPQSVAQGVPVQPPKRPDSAISMRTVDASDPDVTVTQQQQQQQHACACLSTEPHNQNGRANVTPALTRVAGPRPNADVSQAPLEPQRRTNAVSQSHLLNKDPPSSTGSSFGQAFIESRMLHGLAGKHDLAAPIRVDA